MCVRRLTVVVLVVAIRVKATDGPRNTSPGVSLGGRTNASGGEPAIKAQVHSLLSIQSMRQLLNGKYRANRKLEAQNPDFT